MNSIAFTVRILNTLKLTAKHLAKAELEIQRAINIIDKEVIKEIGLTKK